MRIEKRLADWLLAIASILAICATSTAYAQSTISESSVKSIAFRGIQYEHRWSKAGQNEFTPRGQENLESWHDMITFNVYDAVTSGEQLAETANSVLGNYQGAGEILRTNSKPMTPDHPAEHLIVAVLGSPSFLEAVFTRLVLIDGTGVAIVYSHRVYGKPAGQAMNEWLQGNGQQVENALMAWDELPTSMALKTLPQSN